MKKYQHVSTGRIKKSDRVRTISFGQYIKARIAYPAGSKAGKQRAKPGKGKGRIVSLLFSPSKYTLAQAKKWAREHGYRVLRSAKAGTTTSRKVSRKAKRRVAPRSRSAKAAGLYRRAVNRGVPKRALANATSMSDIKKVAKAYGAKLFSASIKEGKAKRRRNPRPSIESVKKMAKARAKRLASKGRAKRLARSPGRRKPAARSAKRYSRKVLKRR